MIVWGPQRLKVSLFLAAMIVLALWVVRSPFFVLPREKVSLPDRCWL